MRTGTKRNDTAIKDKRDLYTEGIQAIMIIILSLSPLVFSIRKNLTKLKISR